MRTWSIPLLAVALTFLMYGACAGDVSTLVYTTDFSRDPGWGTNNPLTNYWDPEMERYHYLLRDATGTYVFKEVEYAGESFLFEFDLRQQRTDKESNFRFGLGDSDMFPNEGSTVFFELSDGKEGRLFWLRMIDQGNHRLERSSQYASSGVRSIFFVDNVTYHVAIAYLPANDMVSVKVTRGIDGSLVWSALLQGAGSLAGADRIYLTTRSDVENPQSSCEGIIDNVKFTVYTIESETPPTEEPTSIPTNGTTVAISSTAIPISTTPRAGLTVMPIVGALLCIACIYAHEYRQRERE
jgi:hypothetical protein